MHDVILRKLRGRKRSLLSMLSPLVAQYVTRVFIPLLSRKVCLLKSAREGREITHQVKTEEEDVERGGCRQERRSYIDSQ